LQAASQQEPSNFRGAEFLNLTNKFICFATCSFHAIVWPNLHTIIAFMRTSVQEF